MVLARSRSTTLFRGIMIVAYSLAAILTLAAIGRAQNPVPLINEPLVPDTRSPGAAGFTLTVNGTGFVSGATVNWKGTALATTFVSSSRLTASVPSSDVAKAGTASVTVINPAPSSSTSNVVSFPISLPVNFETTGSAVPAGTGPAAVVTGDFNRDGKVDLVVGDVDSGNIDVLLGNGDGTFQSPVSYKVGNVGTGQAF